MELNTRRPSQTITGHRAVISILYTEWMSSPVTLPSPGALFFSKVTWIWGILMVLGFRTNFKSTCPTMQAFGRTSSKTCSSQLELQTRKQSFTSSGKRVIDWTDMGSEAKHTRERWFTEVTYGVPQGSVLGPCLLLYIIMISVLCPKCWIYYVCWWSKFTCSGSTLRHLLDSRDKEIQTSTVIKFR